MPTNGLRIYGVDMQSGVEGDVDGYPSPEELCGIATFARGNELARAFCRRAVRGQGRHVGSPLLPGQRNSQQCAGGDCRQPQRILLTLATGTGKTFIAFQLAWKLFKSRWNLKRDGARQPRILFLADRNILADQAYNAFSAFPERRWCASRRRTSARRGACRER